MEPTRAVAALLLALLLALPAQAGTTWVKLSWTAPCDPPDCKRCAQYEGHRLDVAGPGWVTVPVLTGPGTGSQVRPSAPGSLDSGYVAVDNSEARWRQGGTEFAVVAIDSSGNRSDYSNRVLGAEVIERDTTFMRWNSDCKCWTDARSGHSVWFSLPYGDTHFTRIDHLEVVNRAEAANVCRLFLGTRTSGIWWLRGVAQDCGPPNIETLHVAPRIPR